MIVVHVFLASRPEHRASFARVLGELQAATVERDAGCLRYACSVDLADANRFVCLEAWTDMAAVRAHLAAPHHLEADALLDRWRARPAEVRVFTAEETRP